MGTVLTGEAWGIRGPLHPRERLSRNHGCCEGPGRKRGSCWGLAVSWSHQGLRVGMQIRQLEGRLPAQVPATKRWRRRPIPSASRSRQRVDKMAPVPGQAWSLVPHGTHHIACVPPCVRRAVSLPWGFPGGSGVKTPPANAGDTRPIPGAGKSSGEGNGTHSNILAWRIPWTEEPGGPPSIRL